MRLVVFFPLITLIRSSRYPSFEQAPFPHSSLLVEPQIPSPNQKDTDRKRIKSATVILSESEGAVARRSSAPLGTPLPVRSYCSALL